MGKFKIKYGTDPEWFVQKDGKIVPAPFFGYSGLPHTTDPKHPRFYDSGGIVIHQDGVAFEATVPATTDWGQLLSSVHEAQEILLSTLEDYHHLFDDIAIVPAIEYDFKKWNKLGEWMVMANLMGCDTDYDAFNGGHASPIVDATVWPYRYAGGHIHGSGHPLMAENPILAIQILAATVGMTASAYSPHPELEKLRAGLFGAIGRYRPQKYPDGSVGVEFRSPSTTWTDKKNEPLAKKLFSAYEFAVENLMDFPNKAQNLIDELQEYMIGAVSECDQNLCKQLLEYVYDSASH